MSRKQRIIRLLEEMHREERAFIEPLPLAERNARGTMESWAPKDLLAHFAAWNAHMARSLENLSTGGEYERIENIDHANAEIYQKYQAWDVDAILADHRQSYAQMNSALQGTDPDGFEREWPIPGVGQRRLWRVIMGNAYIHPMTHLTEVYHRRGDVASAERIQRQALDHLDQVDDTPEWRGLIRYNFACHLALGGSGAEAIRFLAEALRLNPGLVDWSKQDSDLVSLRDDPAYRAIYAPAADSAAGGAAS